MATVAEAIAQAWEYHQAGQLQEAIWRYEQILQVAPSHPNVWYLLGTACHILENLPEALHCYQQALRFKPNFAEVLGNLGVAYKSQGRLPEAIASYREALRINPDFPAPYNNLGLALADQGNLLEAVASFQQALRLKPDFAEAHYNLAKTLHQQGKLEEAVASYRRALESLPNYVDAYNNLGVALTDLSRHEEAATCLQQALTIDPGCADAHNNLGNILNHQGRLDEAIACYERAVRLRPDHADAYNNLGDALAQQGKWNGAFACVHEALRLRPDFAVAHYNLGRALQEREKLHDAAASYRRAIQHRPDYADAYNHLSSVLQLLGQLDQAGQCLQEALRLRPHFPDAHYAQGVVLQAVGEFAAAEKSFREALAQDPRLAKSLAALATLFGSRLPEQDLSAAGQLLTDPKLTEEEQSALHFALASVHDSREQYIPAARHAREANALDRSMRRKRGEVYDPAAHSRFVDQIIETFTPDFFARVCGWGMDSQSPVFVFGLPRSGSTLVEQILASHSHVHGAGELSLSQDAFDALAAGKGSEEAFAALRRIDPVGIRRLAGDYLGQLAGLNGTATRVVDKMLDNYLHLGLLAVMFPRARFVHCQRDLRDVAISCWLTRFVHINWANDPDAISARFGDYRRLMAHWRQVLPAPILEVSYEALVAGLEDEARRLLNGCGLAWEPGCLAFHETRRTVVTASAAQVRQPIYARSVGRWKHYADALAPVFGEPDGAGSLQLR